MEKIPSQEKISRDMVLNAYKKLVEKGYTEPDPGGLDPNDPEVIEAGKLMDQWRSDQDGDRVYFETEKLFFDAGFPASAYWEDALGFLLQDATRLEDETKDTDKAQLYKDIGDLIKNIKDLLGKSQQ